MSLVEQISVLDRYDEWQKEGKDPQLALYHHKEWEQLFIYSYRPSSLKEVPHYLLAKITYYVSYLLSRVDFDGSKINDHREKLRIQAKEQACLFAEKSTKDLLQKLDLSIAALSPKEEDLQKRVRALETKKNELISETKKLDAQTKEGLEQKIKDLKKEISRLRLFNPYHTPYKGYLKGHPRPQGGVPVRFNAAVPHVALQVKG